MSLAISALNVFCNISALKVFCNICFECMLQLSALNAFCNICFKCILQYICFECLLQYLLWMSFAISALNIFCNISALNVFCNICYECLLQKLLWMSFAISALNVFLQYLLWMFLQYLLWMFFAISVRNVFYHLCSQHPWLLITNLKLVLQEMPLFSTGTFLFTACKLWYAANGVTCTKTLGRLWPESVPILVERHKEFVFSVQIRHRDRLLVLCLWRVFYETDF